MLVAHLRIRTDKRILTRRTDCVNQGGQAGHRGRGSAGEPVVMC
jgi:hypothetical protein